MKCKTLVLAAGLSLAAVSAFAADDFTPTFDLSPVGLNSSATFTGTNVGASVADTMTYFSDSADVALVTTDVAAAADNTALITQMGNGNVAYIEQQNGAGNFAVIAQDGTANPNTAYIAQGSDSDSSDHNYAAILQSGTNNSNNAAIYQVGAFNTATIYQH